MDTPAWAPEAAVLLTGPRPWLIGQGLRVHPDPGPTWRVGGAGTGWLQPLHLPAPRPPRQGHSAEDLPSPTPTQVQRLM